MLSIKLIARAVGLNLKKYLRHARDGVGDTQLYFENPLCLTFAHGFITPNIKSSLNPDISCNNGCIYKLMI